jgi:diguanylate cyclase (GGDEF)-like protein
LLLRGNHPSSSSADLHSRIVLSVCSLTGEELFRAIVRHMAELFGVRFAFVAELADAENGRARLIAAWKDGEYEQGVEFSLAGTPDESVVGRARAYFPDGLSGLFPRDARLREMGLVSFFGEPLFDREGKPLGYFGMMHDKPLLLDPAAEALVRVFSARAVAEVERRREETRLSHLANHDEVTDLPSRALFIDRLNQSLARANWHNVLVAVLRVDMERFKVINDTVGQAVGDRLMQLIAFRLRSCVRDGDTVARLGVEEFAIILVEVKSSDDVAPIARKIQAAFGPAFHVQGHEFVMTTAIGIALYPPDGEDAETLIRSAEAATHSARRQGLSEYQFYAASMNEKAAERLRLEADLRRAIDRGEFEVHYQPQIDLANRRLTGVEALIRWRHPELGLVAPTQFISLLEETGLILPVGEWVLRQACSQKKAWRDEGLAVARMSVNLSSRQLNDPSLVATVRRILGETELKPADLELEITEGMIEDADQALKILHGLSAMGVTLAIDDFGMGYSSLAHLKRFPIDTLKIDRTFVRDVTTDSDDAAIAKAIIAMAHSLKLKVIAEGVETREQLAFLKGEECDEFQGFLYSKAIPGRDLAQLLSRAPGPMN